MEGSLRLYVRKVDVEIAGATADSIYLRRAGICQLRRC